MFLTKTTKWALSAFFLLSFEEILQHGALKGKAGPALRVPWALRFRAANLSKGTLKTEGSN